MVAVIIFELENEAGGFGSRVFGVEYRSGHRHTVHTGFPKGRYIVGCYSADGHNGDFDSGLPALLHYGAVTFKSQDGAQVFFRSGETEWSQSYIVGAGRGSRLNIGKRIGGGSYDFVRSEDGTSFCHRHVIFAEMHAVGTDCSYKMHMVVKNQCRTETVAKAAQLASLDRKSVV